MSYNADKRRENGTSGQWKRYYALFLIVAAILLSGCSLKRLEVTEVSKAFLQTAEHVPGFLGASEATPMPETPDEGTEQPPTSIPQWGVTDSEIWEGNAGSPDWEQGLLPDLPVNSPTPTPTSTPTPSPTPTSTPTPSPTPTITPTPILGTYEKGGDYAEVPTFSGDTFVITDYKTGEVLLAKDSGKRIYPASTIKMLTALTALDYKDMANELTSKKEVLDAIPFDAYSYGAVAGMTFPMEVWMNMLMISSCADAADTIAAGAAGSVKQFVVYMNEKAEELGLSETHVDNAIGLDIGNGYTEMYSTAEDIAKLAKAYMRNSVLAAIVAKAEYTVPDCDVMAGKKIESTNFYLSKPELYHSDLFEVIGTKSGMTDAAGTCQVITTKDKDGRKLICCYFGGKNKDTIFKEMTGLLEYCYKNIK